MKCFFKNFYAKEKIIHYFCLKGKVKAVGRLERGES